MKVFRPRAASGMLAVLLVLVPSALVQTAAAQAPAAQTSTGRETSAASVASYALSELMPFDPDVVFSMFGMFLGMFGIQPKGEDVHICGSPLYHTAVLVFAGGALHMGFTVVLMDKWTPESMLALIDKYRVTNSHMVPRPYDRPSRGEVVRHWYSASSDLCQPSMTLFSTGQAAGVTSPTAGASGE